MRRRRSNRIYIGSRYNRRSPDEYILYLLMDILFYGFFPHGLRLAGVILIISLIIIYLGISTHATILILLGIIGIGFTIYSWVKQNNWQMKKYQTSRKSNMQQSTYQSSINTTNNQTKTQQPIEYRVRQTLNSCPTCGDKVLEGDTFCASCGTKL